MLGIAGMPPAAAPGVVFELGGSLHATISSAEKRTGMASTFGILEVIGSSKAAATPFD